MVPDNLRGWTISTITVELHLQRFLCSVQPITFLFLPINPIPRIDTDGFEVQFEEDAGVVEVAMTTDLNLRAV